jgi:hypothetical protein
MRGFLSSLVAASALSLGVGIPSRALGGATGLPSGPSFGRGGRGKRTRFPKDHYRSCDPYFGIKSRGRTGAKHRARLMAEAYAKLGRRNRDNPTGKPSNPFVSKARNAAFFAAIKDGNSHNQALRLARRVPA